MLDKRPEYSPWQFGSGIYEGQVDKEGNACGQGKWKCTEPTDHWSDKGTTIEGSFKDNLPDGFAIMVYGIDKERYEGEWSKGRLHGKVTHYTCEGDIYNEVYKHGNEVWSEELTEPDTVHFGDGMKRWYNIPYQTDEELEEIKKRLKEEEEKKKLE